MNFILIYPEIRDAFLSYTGGYNEGVCSICTYLSSLGHQVKLMHITNKKSVAKDGLLNEMAEFKPDLIGFSVMTPNFKYARQINTFIKEELGCRTILGGVHAMFSYREILKSNSFDFVCVGEGEYCLPELMQKLDDAANNRISVAGILTNKSDLNSDPAGCFVRDLDSLPVCDRKFFDFPNLRESKEKQAQFIAGRGCPFNCTYCANKFKRKILGASKVRMKSPQRVIDEIKTVLAEYDFIQSLFFQDDILPLDKEWFFEFVDLYKHSLDKAFSCNVHPVLITEQVCEALSAIGCNYVQIGVESGNERVRNQILNRKMSNSQIKEKVRLLKKYNIKPATFNMIGNYTETMAEALDTVKLNAEIKSERAYSTVFVPYPGTELNIKCRESKSFIADKEPEDYPDYTEFSIIKHKDFGPDRIVFIVRYFNLLILAYRIFPYALIDFVLNSRFFPYKTANGLIKWLRPKLIYIYCDFIAKYKPRFQ